MDMVTRQVLMDARALISDPARWTHTYWARDAQGKQVPPEAPTAVCWCMAGALNRVGGGASPAVMQAIAILSAGDPMRLFEYNDTHTHAEVLALFDRALAS